MSNNAVKCLTLDKAPLTSRFYVVSIRKLIYMTILTSGLYVPYWFYRNWATFRDATGVETIPLLRCIVPVLFVFPLVRCIDHYLKQSKIQHDWSPGLVGLTLWLVMVLSLVSLFLFPLPTGDLRHDAFLTARHIFEMMLQLLATLWVMCRIQKAVNVLEGDPQGASNSRSTRANNGWMMLGTSNLMMVFYTFALNLAIAFP